MLNIFASIFLIDSNKFNTNIQTEFRGRRTKNCTNIVTVFLKNRENAASSIEKSVNAAPTFFQDYSEKWKMHPPIIKDIIFHSKALYTSYNFKPWKYPYSKYV